MRRLRLITVGLAASLCAVGAPAAALGAGSLVLTKHTIAFTGKMTTTWTQLPHDVGSPDTYCWTGTESGQGKQVVRFRTTGRPTLTVNSVAGGPFFQILPLSRRATPGRVAPGFGRAKIARTGSLVTTYGTAPDNPIGCDPPPPPSPADATDCGAHTAPWDLQFQVYRGILHLSVNALPKTIYPCPFFEPNVAGQGASQASFPTTTSKRVGNIARRLGRRGAKLVVRGSRSWQSRGGDGGTLTAKTTVTWTLKVRRIR